jgi:hypothetical protein
MKRENAIKSLDKISPWIFLPFQEFDFLNYRKKREQITSFNEKMFWQGSGVDSYRNMIKLVENKGFLQSVTPMSHNDYLESLINSKIGLSYYLGLDKYTTPFDPDFDFKTTMKEIIEPNGRDEPQKKSIDNIEEDDEINETDGECTCLS